MTTAPDTYLEVSHSYGNGAEIDFLAWSSNGGRRLEVSEGSIVGIKPVASLTWASSAKISTDDLYVSVDPMSSDNSGTLICCTCSVFDCR